MSQNSGELLGTDFLLAVLDDVGTTDITLDLAENHDGRSVYLRAIFLRLTTRRGGLWYDPTYGLDVRHYLLDVASDAQIQQEVAAQCMKDERTANAAVAVERTPRRSGDLLTITVQLTTIFGQVYPMTLSIDAANGVQLITQQAP